MSAHGTSALLLLLGARWKAIAAFVGSLATALLIVYPSSHILQLVIGVVGALVTTTAVHQVTNVATDTVGTVGTVVGDVNRVVGTALGGDGP